MTQKLSQEVFIKAHKGLHNYRGDAQMYTWLRRIAINTYLNSKRKKSFSLMGLWSDPDTELYHPSTDPDPEQLTDQTMTNTIVNRALETLTPRERTAFILRHHQELSTSEVAASMDVADGTVKSLLFRATKKLQKELAYLRNPKSQVEAISL